MHGIFATPLGRHIMTLPFLLSSLLISILLLLTTSVASLTLSAGQHLIPEPPATANSSDLSANASLANVQLASSSNLSHMIIQCDPTQYGDDLNYDSCYDAYDQIPHLISEMTWGPRTQGRWTINLPWRVYSCALHCSKQSPVPRPLQA